MVFDTPHFLVLMNGYPIKSNYSHITCLIMQKRIPSGSGFVGGSIGNTLMEEMRKDLATSKSPRVIVPLMHIYLEHVFELLLKNKWDKADKVLQGRPSYLQKLQLVYSLNIIGDVQYEDLKNINNIRNQFAHSFKPDDSEITKLCMKLTNHPFTEKRAWIDMYTASVIGLMSELTKVL